jgi:hypothetical protein
MVHTFRRLRLRKRGGLIHFPALRLGGLLAPSFSLWAAIPEHHYDSAEGKIKAPSKQRAR